MKNLLVYSLLIFGLIYKGSPSTLEVLRTPQSRFTGLQGYPWPPNYIKLNLPGKPPLWMHYLDLGPNDAPETVLLLHGTPAWSYLYRKMIPFLLEAGYRVIAPDFIGFGRSDKLTQQEAYTHQLHAESLLQLVAILNLQGVTLFGQDLGGPTGLSVVRRMGSRFRKLILLNTWIPQGDIFSSTQFTLRHAPYLMWRVASFYLDQLVPVGPIFNFVTEASNEEVHGYTAPYPSNEYKAGPAQWPLLVPVRPTDPMAVEMQRVKYFLQTEWKGPVLYGYSDGEMFTKPGGDLFRELFKYNGCEVEVDDAGHFLQEDQGEVVARLTINFIKYGC